MDALRSCLLTHWFMQLRTTDAVERIAIKSLPYALGPATSTTAWISTATWPPYHWLLRAVSRGVRSSML
jgi:hypothetical protein